MIESALEALVSVDLLAFVVELGLEVEEAVEELKERFPALNGEPFAKRGKFKTSIRNWQRKIGDVKPGDHIDLVVEQHEEARAILASLPPADAVGIADELLKKVLH